MTGLPALSSSRLDQIVSARDAAVERARQAGELLRQAADTAEAGLDIAAEAYGKEPRWAGIYGDGVFALARKSARSVDERVEAERKRIDACVWLMMYEALGLWDVMSTRQKGELRAELESNPPPVTADAARERMTKVLNGATGMIRQAMAEAFTSLDRRFKSNDPSCLKPIAKYKSIRIIITNVMNDCGLMYSSDEAWSTIADIERIFVALDDRKLLVGDDGEVPMSLFETVNAHPYDERIGEFVSRYFRVRLFKNGNAHLWFTRPDLVNRVNIELAAYFGKALYDAVPADEPTVTTALAKNLSFYRTPAKVVDRLVDDIYGSDLKVLEPSAGDGAIVKALLRRGHHVEAVEVDPGRFAALGELACDRLTARRANFLQMTARPVFDAVGMNPPFHGTHWMNHVYHAWEFLKPGGQLVAVLPISADLGTTKAHKAFRKWATPFLRFQFDRGRIIQDLPLGAFKESGTMVSTGILCLRKPR